MFITWYRTKDKIDKIQKKVIRNADDNRSDGFLSFKKNATIAKLKSSLDTIDNTLKSKWNEIRDFITKDLDIIDHVDQEVMHILMKILRHFKTQN